ncbi:protein kinase domain-containing protein [Vacuolonema iberomarrocanum]|uniref:protein kinase domain-containing protein n=1 Tax=Vacuolonema iberomarrocanum TaxID=3454632 RepID=UPI0019F8D0B5|nr:serine/threonine protein kinase [filamentous cyanobacterium LEGE 07170]
MESSTSTITPRRASKKQDPSRLNAACGSSERLHDRYQVIRALGRGGFGVTFLAQDMQLPGEPHCVIKQLCPKVDNPAAFERACERFEREAKTLSQLGSHAHIPRLLDYFQIEDEFYLVQEYIRGTTLARQVKRHGTHSEKGVKQFLLEILPILDFVHRQQVIHRDIKPPNLIRCEDDNRLVLIDFGAVKEEIVGLENTQRGATTQFVGTLGFSPPEQLAMRPTYSSDIYAVGVTCLYLLTGKPPMDFAYDPYSGEICWQEEVDVSEYFARLLDRMLKASVGERYQSVEQVLRALELEPYIDNLSDCMNTKRRLSDSMDDEDQSSAYSPFNRTAEQIRQWRCRLRQHQSQKENLLPRSGYSADYCQ